MQFIEWWLITEFVKVNYFTLNSNQFLLLNDILGWDDWGNLKLYMIALELSL